MGLTVSDKLALIREYKKQGGKGHYLPVIKQFANGGDVPIPYNYLPNAKSRTFLQPTSSKLPSALNNIGNPWIEESSSERAISIGGENGEPAYMVPSFKYGKPLTDPVQEFRKTGEHLGGPFKTWQQAEEYEKIRHQYMGKELPSPIATRSYANGGGITKPSNRFVEATERPAYNFPYDGTSKYKGGYDIDKALEIYEPDETGHLPSVDYRTGEWLKDKNYPTAWKEFYETQTNPELFNTVGFPIQNERGRLQYTKGYALGGQVTQGIPYNNTNVWQQTLPTNQQPLKSKSHGM